MSVPPVLPEALRHLGYDERVDAAFLPHLGCCVPARVCAVERGGVDVLAADGPRRATFGADVLAAAARDPLAAPGVGDWVALRSWPDGRETVDAVLDRRGLLVRHGAGRAALPQLLAAGVDVVGIVEPLWPEPDLARIERLLVLAWNSGAVPLVLLTKSDLVGDATWLLEDVSRAAPGADVLLVSTVSGDGLDAVRERLGPGRTLALLGRSGAGKSTLVNALAGEELLATGPVRQDGKGRHVSTRRELVVLPGVGVLVDTPGLRGVGLSTVDEGLGAAFSDVESLFEDCRFNDCRHESEPGCAVLAAVQDGTLDERRLLSWRKLQREARWVATRTDARARAERRKEWVRRSRASRRRWP